MGMEERARLGRGQQTLPLLGALGRTRQSHAPSLMVLLFSFCQSSPGVGWMLNRRLDPQPGPALRPHHAREESGEGQSINLALLGQ